MIPKKYSSEAIVLASRKFSEADRIIVLYTKNYGKLSVIAKGVRKPKSRKRGHLEVFSHIKFSASRGKTLDIVTEVELINSFLSVRKSLRKASVAFFFVETVGRLTRDEAKNERLFALLYHYLKSLPRAKALRQYRYRFTKDVLVLLGFWPKLKKMDAPDKELERVVERQMFSVRVGKKILV